MLRQISKLTIPKSTPVLRPRRKCRRSRYQIAGNPPMDVEKNVASENSRDRMFCLCNHVGTVVALDFSRSLIRGRRFFPGQITCMKPQMVLDETGNKEIAVIVILLHAQIERHTRAFARVAQQLRLELGFEKLILRALVNQERWALPAPRFDQGGGVILSPCVAVRSEISG